MSGISTNMVTSPHYRRHAPPRPRSEAKRMRIIDAAMRHFAEQGYDAVRVGYIAAELGIAKGSIFQHFGSKDGLVFEVYKKAVRSFPTYLAAPAEARERGFYEVLRYWGEYRAPAAGRLDSLPRVDTGKSWDGSDPEARDQPFSDGRRSRSARPSQPRGVGLRPAAERTLMAGVSSGLCAGTEPGRVSVVAVETARVQNFCPTTFGQLSHYARQALRRMRRRPTLVIAFWQQADLFSL